MAVQPPLFPLSDLLQPDKYNVLPSATLYVPSMERPPVAESYEDETVTALAGASKARSKIVVHNFISMGVYEGEFAV